MPPEETVWALEPHTKGKHEVLSHYLDAWLPIMLHSNDRVRYIDAFAGPGLYQGGELGSPLIAIERFIALSRTTGAKGSIAFDFIESEHNRYMHLKSVLTGRYPELPPNATWEAHPGTFDDTMTKILDQLDDQRLDLPPALVMIDPFGVSDTPMSTVQRILQNPKAEVYFTFMYHTVNRFATADQYDSPLTNLFGSDEWRDGAEIRDENDRFAFFVNLYKRGLTSAGAKQLLHFTIDKEDRPNYYAIIYATKSTKGSDEMKKAIWKVDPQGDFRFVGGNRNQVSFGERIVNFDDLQRQLIDRYRGKGWIPMGDIEDFVKSGETHFHSGHLRARALTPMEDAGVIEVRRSAGSSGFATKVTEVRFSGRTAREGRLF